MSGPKIDHAELERQRKIELERQRLERLRRINEATNNLVLTQDRIKKTIRDIISDLNYELTFCSEVLKNEIQRAKDDAIETLNQVIAVKSVPTEADEINCLNQLMICAFNKTYGDTYLHKINQIKAIIETERKDEANDEKLRAAFTFNQFVKTEDNNSKGDDNKDNLCFDFHYCEDDFAPDNKVEGLFENIEELINSDAITLEDMKYLFEFRSDLIASLNLDFNAQKAVISEAELLIQKIKYNIQLFNDIYMSYYSEYILYINEINKTRRSKMLDILPKEKHQFKSINELEDELSMVRIRTRKLSQQNYIRRQLDEVMKELGYHISEEVIFNSANCGQHLICRSGTDATALHVHISDSKNVMIEVVGCHNGAKDEYDKIVTADELTNQETEKLIESQNRFCEIHPIISKKLKERGVIFNPVSHKMPSLKYCKKIIINTGEEVLTDERLVNKTHRESNMPLLAQLAIKSEGEKS